MAKITLVIAELKFNELKKFIYVRTEIKKHLTNLHYEDIKELFEQIKKTNDKYKHCVYVNCFKGHVKEVKFNKKFTLEG